MSARIAMASAKGIFLTCNRSMLAEFGGYRIAGNFRGIQFSWFSRLTGKSRKLNPRNKSLNAHSRYSDRPSLKIISRNLCTAFPRKSDPSKISGYTVCQMKLQ